jgi:hypothetical protein
MAANLTANDELDFDFKLESRTPAAATITQNYGLPDCKMTTSAKCEMQSTPTAATFM